MAYEYHINENVNCKRFKGKKIYQNHTNNQKN